MYKNMKSFVYETADHVIKNRISNGAAALAYYLTMTIFPLLICLYTMLGTQYKQAMQAVGIIGEFMATETVHALSDFVSYVAANNNQTMLFAALLVLITSASAAFRTFQVTIGKLQGEIRFRGFFGMIISIGFSLVFLAAIYFSILIMMTGSWFIELLVKWLPFANIFTSWTWVRFIIFFGLIYLLIWSLYNVTMPRKKRYKVTVGALAAAVALVVVSIVFSVIIGASAKYPLVYGSLASIILLMFWLYVCGYVLIMGDVINIVIRDRRQRKKALESALDDNSTHD